MNDSESSSYGPGPSPAPSSESGALGPACDGSGLPCGHPTTGHNDGPCCALCEALLEVEVLHQTNQRLNRRCQQAEAAAARSADSVKAELYGRRKGKPLGRMLANIRLTELEAAADALAEAAELLLADQGRSHSGRASEDIIRDFRDTRQALTDALAAYRAVRSTPRKEGDAP